MRENGAEILRIYHRLLHSSEELEISGTLSLTGEGLASGGHRMSLVGSSCPGHKCHQGHAQVDSNKKFGEGGKYTVNIWIVFVLGEQHFLI